MITLKFGVGLFRRDTSCLILLLFAKAKGLEASLLCLALLLLLESEPLRFCLDSGKGLSIHLILYKLRSQFCCLNAPELSLSLLDSDASRRILALLFMLGGDCKLHLFLTLTLSFGSSDNSGRLLLIRDNDNRQILITHIFLINHFTLFMQVSLIIVVLRNYRTILLLLVLKHFLRIQLFGIFWPICHLSDIF